MVLGSLPAGISAYAAVGVHTLFWPEGMKLPADALLRRYPRYRDIWGFPDDHGSFVFIAAILRLIFVEVGLPLLHGGH